MSINELTELRAQIDQMIQLKQPTFRVGMKCEVDSPKVAGLIGEIIKVNQVRCKVKFANPNTFNVLKVNQTFNVPKSMITLK